MTILLFNIVKLKAALLSPPGGECRGNGGRSLIGCTSSSSRRVARLPSAPALAPSALTAPSAKSNRNQEHPPDDRCAAPLPPQQHQGCLHHPSGRIRPSKPKRILKLPKRASERSPTLAYSQPRVNHNACESSRDQQLAEASAAPSAYMLRQASTSKGANYAPWPPTNAGL